MADERHWRSPNRQPGSSSQEESVKSCIRKLNRYFAVVALLTLGEDKQIADVVRQLTPKVTALVERAGSRKREFERLSTEMQQALGNVRDAADRRLGNVKE